MKKGAVPSGVKQVIHHWVKDELRKNSWIICFTQYVEFELVHAYYLSEENLRGEVSMNKFWLH